MKEIATSDTTFFAEISRLLQKARNDCQVFDSERKPADFCGKIQNRFAL
jgi:hypothetical protein